MNPTSKTIQAVAIAATAALSFTPSISAQEEGGLPLPKYIVNKYDADKNGKLEGEEVKTLLAAVDANKKEIAAAKLKRFDADKNGELDEKESRTAKKTIREEEKEIKTALIKKFDADGDGALKGKEYKGTKEWRKTTYPDAIPKVLVHPRFELPKA